MKALRLHQRVLVRACGDDDMITLPEPMTGTVVRLRIKDNGAFIKLDRRSSDERAHPFPADDQRGNHVLAFPEDCDRVG